MARNCITFCLTVLCLGQLIVGCARVGPEYIKPEPESPRTWNTPIDHGLTADVSDPAVLAQWWTLLNDPLLNDFIQLAIDGNLNLEQARTRLLAARAKRDMSAATLWPSIDFKGARTTSKRGSASSSTRYSSNLDAGWELDFFGGARSSVEAATDQLDASREDLRDVLVSLIAEVALNYVDIRTYQARLQIAGENLAAQQETYSITEARYQSGLDSELALQQAKYSMANTRAQIPNIQTGLTQVKNALAVLLGQTPGSLNEQLQATVALSNLPLSVAVGIPAEVLRRRPDIRKAERQLAAQTAQIGVATAALYPSFRLSGSIGFDALTAGTLFNSSNFSSSFGPSVTLPIFDAGSIRANIRMQTAMQEEAFASYQAVVLGALEEVENALTAYAQEQERNRILQEAAEAAGQAVNLAEMQYQAGLVAFSEVLDTRRSVLSIQEQLAQSTGTMTANLIRLYKALGGGWESFVPETSKTTED